MTTFVYVGLVDEAEEVHEMAIERSTAQAALERGWMVLDEALLGVPVAAHGPEDEDDGA
jgi:hypothetical protein